MAPWSKLAVFVALVAVASCHPQYQGPADQVGGTGHGVHSASGAKSDDVIPTHGSDGSLLTEEQRQALKEFWAKVEGAFGTGGVS